MEIEQATVDAQAELVTEAKRHSDDLHAIRVAVQIIAGLLLLLVLVGFVAIAGR